MVWRPQDEDEPFVWAPGMGQIRSKWEYEEFYGVMREAMDSQEAESMHVMNCCISRNVVKEVMQVVAGYLKPEPPEANAPEAEEERFRAAMREDRVPESRGALNLALALVEDMIIDAFRDHIHDTEAYAGPTPFSAAAIATIRLTNYMWLSFLRLPGQSWREVNQLSYST